LSVGFFYFVPQPTHSDLIPGTKNNQARKIFFYLFFYSALLIKKESKKKFFLSLCGGQRYAVSIERELLIHNRQRNFFLQPMEKISDGKHEHVSGD
jgi:hypothetical protein